jgi:hypothetical protein
MNNLNLSRNLAARSHACNSLALSLLAGWLAIRATQAAGLAATNTPAAIPWNQIGAKAGADYQGDGLAVTPTESGARLHCIFQRLDGEATPEGLWLTSTVTNSVSDRFRIVAAAVGRVTPCAPVQRAGEMRNLEAGGGAHGVARPTMPLPAQGTVSIEGQTARFSRPGLTEEYSVSMDGVRQDFIVEQAPASLPAGEMVVKLAVAGAQVEPAADGARLVLEKSGRKIAYSRLRVTDATGKELPARIEVVPVGVRPSSGAASRVGLRSASLSDASRLSEVAAPEDGRTPGLLVLVTDAEAVYPVRIDPTFSDANWVSMGGFPGVSGSVSAAVTDTSGNLYIGGQFTVVGNAIANHVAKWNGSTWSALGSGMGGYYSDVYALAVSGGTLYAGGDFTTAGGNAATNIAQWNGSSWSALGSGMGGISYSSVYALAVSGGTLYAGGNFFTAGTNVSGYAAMANLPGSLAIITTNAAFGFTGGVFGFDVTGPSGASVVIQGSTDLQTWIPLQTNLLGSGPLYFSDAQSTTNVQRFYRAQLSQ